MKKLIFLALLASTSAMGQISISSFGSLNYANKGTDFKKRLGGGFNLSYNLNENVGIGIQWKHHELCEVSSKNGTVIPFNSKSLEFFVHHEPKKDDKWFIIPRAGILVGLGTPIKDKNHPQSLEKRKEDLKLMDPSIFAGVIIEAVGGVRLSSKFLLCLYIRNEGMVGMITNRAISYENGGTFGSISTGFRLHYIFHERKNPYQD